MNCFNIEDKKAAKINQNIDNLLRNERIKNDLKLKILLLGNERAGKNTFLKQMRIIHSIEYSDDEILHFKYTIYYNIISSIQLLIQVAEHCNFKIKYKSAKQLILNISLQYTSIEYTKEISNAIYALWNEKGIQKAFKTHHHLKYNFNYSISYLLDNCNNYSSSDYILTKTDILYTQNKKIGISELEFKVDKTSVSIIDISGQKNSRRKWIHLFDDISYIIFIVDISEYDIVLREDDCTTPLRESLLHFDEVINFKYFSDTSIILLLNKIDIFEEKIKEIDLNCCFSEYKGGVDYDNALSYIKNLFQICNLNWKRQIFCHYTNTIDTTNIKHVFRAFTNILTSIVLG